VALNTHHISRTEVKERVQLYLYSPSGPPWPVVGRNLPLPLPYIYINIAITALSKYTNFRGEIFIDQNSRFFDLGDNQDSEEYMMKL